MARKRGRPKKISGVRGSDFHGVKEMQDKISELRNAMAFQEAYDALGAVAEMGRQTLERNMAAANWPSETKGSAFSYAKIPPGAPRARSSALFGMRKKGRHSGADQNPAFVEWIATANPSPKARDPKRKQGEVVGESLNTMYEYGSSKTIARPAFQPAVAEVRSAAPAMLAKEFKAIIDRHTKK